MIFWLSTQNKFEECLPARRGEIPHLTKAVTSPSAKSPSRISSSSFSSSSSSPLTSERVPAYFQLAKRRFDAENFVRLKWPTFPVPSPSPQPAATAAVRTAVSILRDENDAPRSQYKIEAEGRSFPGRQTDVQTAWGVNGVWTVDRA